MNSFSLSFQSLMPISDVCSPPIICDEDNSELVSVLHIDHWKDGNAGKYFYVDCNVWTSFLTANSLTCVLISGASSCTLPTIYQYRKGELIYYGPITMIEEAPNNGGCHGRRTALASVRNWQPNDLIYAAAIGTFFACCIQRC
jgi:hypothetical protein